MKRDEVPRYDHSSNSQLSGIERRTFLKTASLAGAAGAFAMPWHSTASADGASPLDDRLKLSAFQPRLGRKFRLRRTGHEPIDVRLVDAQRSENGNRPRHVRQDPFSLIFKAPEATEFEAGMWTLDCPATGNLELFLSTVGPSSSGVAIQAVVG